MMDWYSWLSESGLHPSLASEYALLLSRNELEESDIPDFDHDFLNSMGISVAKHRLHILKLARRSRRPRSATRILAAIKRAKNRLTMFVATWAHRCETSAIVVVPMAGGSRWRGGVVRRSKRVAGLRQGRLMLTDGGSKLANDRKTSPMVVDGDDDDGFWKNGGEEIRWDSMFQNLKPT